MVDFLPALAPGRIATRVLQEYWPVFVLGLFYAPFLITSTLHKTHNVLRDTWLRLGSSTMVTIWALITVILIILSLDVPHGRLSPQWLLLVGIDATVALFVVLTLIALRAALSDRLGIPSGITVGNAAAVAAVYGNIVLVVLVATQIT